MFNLKKKTPPGQCSAMRCKSAAADLLCHKHLEEWEAAGRPTLGAVEPAAQTALAKPPKAPKADKLTQAFPAELEAEVLAQRTGAEQALQLVATTAITGQPIVDWLGQSGRAAASAIEAAETLRKQIKAPHLERGRAVDALFNPLIETYETILSTIKRRLGEIGQIAREAQQQALQAVGAGSNDQNTLAVAHGAAALEQPEGTYEVETWDFEVTDEKQIPRDFFTLDRSLLLAYIKAKSGQCVIPGVRHFKRVDVRVRKA